MIQLCSQFSPKSSQLTSRSLPLKARYGVSFVSSEAMMYMQLILMNSSKEFEFKYSRVPFSSKYTQTRHPIACPDGEL